MSDHLMVCGVGSGMDRSLNLIKDLNLRLTVITDTVTDWIRHYSDHIIIASPRNVGAVCRAFNSAKLTDVTAIFSLGYEAPMTVAALAELAKCRGTTREIAMNCTLKDQRVSIFQTHGVPSPLSRIARSMADALEVLDEIGVPSVVKPNDKTSSIGVSKITSVEGAAPRLREAFEQSGSGCVILEEFLTGTEHTVEGLVFNGELLVTGISDRNYGEKERFQPYFFENGDTLPSKLSGGKIKELIEVSQQAIQALGLHNEVFSNDLLVTADGRVVVLEVACRLSGSRFGTDVVPLSTGVNILPNAVRLALGRPLMRSELQASKSRPVVLRYRPCEGGTVRWVNELEVSMLEDPRLHDIFWEMDLRPGVKLPVYKNGKHMLAGVITCADSLEEAEAVASDALGRLPIGIEM